MHYPEEEKTWLNLSNHTSGKRSLCSGIILPKFEIPGIFDFKIDQVNSFFFNILKCFTWPFHQASSSFFLMSEMCVWPTETNFKNLKNRTFASPPHCWDLAISLKWQNEPAAVKKNKSADDCKIGLGNWIWTCQLNIWPSVSKFNIYSYVSNLKIVIFALNGFRTMRTLIITSFSIFIVNRD